MVVRRLRQHPPLFGRASTFVADDRAPELEEVSERFLRRIGYYGLVELEYKHDVRDGQTKLLDVNARTWGYHSLGQRAGVDFPVPAVRRPAGAAGRPTGCARRPACPGSGWRRTCRRRSPCWHEEQLDWRAYARSLRAANVESVFSRDDPLPGLAELALLPYLAVKRGILSASFAEDQAVGER